jgi:hypothetical protein
MKQRMRYLVLVALAASTTLVGACNDDGDSIGVDDKGGSAGASGSKTGGSSAGGSASKAGNDSGGKAGNATAGTSAAGTSAAGTSSTAGAGGAGEGGTGGATDGGADGNGAGAGGDGGAAGAGGAGEPALVYKCGSSTLIRKQCSALAAADCEDPTICSDCIDLYTGDREAFQLDPPCPACNAKWDAFAQCQVDAFESGDLAFGVQCFPGYGADGSDNCYPFLDEAIECQGYVGNEQTPHACPATWPL